MRFRRALRRAAKVSLGAFAGALACAGIAVGAVDGAAVLAPRPSVPGMMVVVAVAALAVIAVIRRAQFTPPSARAQRVSFWLHAATDLADIELALALIAALYVLILVTGAQRSPAYPVLYALVAFAVTVLARPGAIAAVGAAIFLEGALVVRVGRVPRRRRDRAPRAPARADRALSPPPPAPARRRAGRAARLGTRLSADRRRARAGLAGAARPR
jgi:hypothetical protein